MNKNVCNRSKHEAEPHFKLLPSINPKDYNNNNDKYDDSINSADSTRNLPIPEVVVLVGSADENSEVTVTVGRIVVVLFCVIVIVTVEDAVSSSEEVEVKVEVVGIGNGSVVIAVVTGGGVGASRATIAAAMGVGCVFVLAVDMGIALFAVVDGVFWDWSVAPVDVAVSSHVARTGYEAMMGRMKRGLYLIFAFFLVMGLSFVV